MRPSALDSFSPALHPPTQELEIQTLIAGGSYEPPSASSASSSFPPTHLSAADPITPALRSLLNETSDALDSPDAALVRALSLDKLFSLAIEKLEVAFRSPTADGRGARFEDVTEKQARLASLLPVLTRLSAGKGDAIGAVLASGVNGNEFVEVRLVISQSGRLAQRLIRWRLSRTSHRPSRTSGNCATLLLFCTEAGTGTTCERAVCCSRLAARLVNASRSVEHASLPSRGAPTTFISLV